MFSDDKQLLHEVKVNQPNPAYTTMTPPSFDNPKRKEEQQQPVT